ncbi:MAG TPA: CotH kinase family protein [Vicinamibacterales bacterium]
MISIPAFSWRRALPVLAVGAIVAAVAAVLDGAHLFPGLRFAVQRNVQLLPSTAAVPVEEVKRGLPIVSLWLDEPDLHDPERGILANPLGRGRDWERPASFTYFQGGRPVFGTAAGVRVHGGGSRLTSRVQSLRVYFRRSYGMREAPPGLFFGGRGDPLRQLVLHNDLRDDSNGITWHFTNPLAYDIVRRVGGLTVNTQPAQLYLNGKWIGTYVLTEHISRQFFRAHFGHDQFRFEDAGEDLYHWVRANRPVTMRKLTGYVDVENLTSWFLAVLFCGTEDQFQAPSQVYDQIRNRWFWIAWDMDQSFLFSRGVGVERNSFDSTLDRGRVHRGRRRTEVRGTILADLLHEDPEYRSYFQRRFAQMLNHQVTPEFLRARYAYYARVVQDFGVPHDTFLRHLRVFLRTRPDILWAHATRELGTGDPVRLEISGAEHAVVDGQVVRLPYRGRYFPGMEIEIRPAPDALPGAGPWLVDGEERGVEEGAALRLTLRKDTLVTLLRGGDS